MSWWPGNVQVGGTHIHHLVWGILLLLIMGYVGVAIAPPSPWHEIVTVLFGVGTGLTLDEFALWLNLKDVYWSQQGRRSIDAVIIAATITGIVLVGFTAWLDVATEVEDAVFAVVGAFGVLAILIAARQPGQGEVRHGRGRLSSSSRWGSWAPSGSGGLTRFGRACSIASTRRSARAGGSASPSHEPAAQPAAGQSAAGSG